ncbi:MAG TPA: indole-3-glycerol phosphate synthase TrpC [Acidimicrobiales bacterium]|nr:indole-3-glycerol phosphate synthase TrpC [Acidimicrobiales bacterium]
MATYLDTILDAHRRAAALDPRPLDELVEAARSEGPTRGFAAALAAADGLAVVAEVKKRSPSLGDLAPEAVPGVLAKAYADGGATCLSVLTDAEFFGGSPSDLGEARAATDLPVLRKDFTVSERDVCDARLIGADAVLLIVAALSDDELGRFLALAADVGLDALVEVHDEAEAGRALAVGATVVGVNQRDLATFEVDTDRAVRVASAIPDGVVKVAESGIRGPGDAARLAAAGYHAVLVGEALVTSDDPAAAVRALRACS